MPLSLSRARLTDLLAAGRRARVLVVGDAMLDEYLIGDVERISPEAPVPVVRVRERKYALGGAANVAQNVVASGASCRFVAVVGEDDAGDRVLKLLGKLGVATDGMIRTSRPTTRKTRVLGRSQQLARIDDENDDDLTTADASRVTRAVEAAMDAVDAVILEDYNKGVLIPSVIEKTIALAKAKKRPIIVDPKYRHFFAYRGATVFKPNRRELDSALGAELDVDHPSTIPSAMQKLDVEHLLLTLGERGMVLASRTGAFKEVPTVAREVFDVVGAGDTVTAYVAVMMAAGGTVEEAAVIANYAAGVEIGKLGAATVSPEEVLAAYDDHATSGSR